MWACGDCVVVDRVGGPGLLREEVATVGAAVAGVAIFWSLLAFTMCAVVRMHKRKQRRRMRGGSDVDAQTAMMEAMVRAELARGRSRVSDSHVPTYVNVIRRSSSSRDLDMSDFFQLALDNNQHDSHGVWTKQHHNAAVTCGRTRDQDGDRTTAQTHRCSLCRRQQDDRCLLNCWKDVENSGQSQCNGVLTRVKSLDSVSEVVDETAG